MKKNLLWLLIPVALLLAWAPAMAVQHLINGDMETWTAGPDGPPDHWTPSASTITAIKDSSTVHSGSYSAKVVWTASGTLRLAYTPNIAFVENEHYVCSVWVYDPTPGVGTGPRTRPWYALTPAFTGFGPPWPYSQGTGAWEVITVDTIIPAGTTSFIFQMRFFGGGSSPNGRDSLWIDDITLDGPTPSENIPPSVTSVYSHPFPCYPTDLVTGSAIITDADGTIAKDSLYFRVNSGVWNAVRHDSLAVGNPNMYWYTIGTYPAGSFVEYNAMAIDDDGARSQSSNYNYTVTPTVTPHVAIYPLQYTTNAGTNSNCYPSDSINTPQTISGIVVGRYERTTAGYHSRFFLQDAGTPWSGIYVYDNTAPDTVQIGDSVTVTGVVAEYYSETEFGTISSFTKHLSGHALFNPVIRTCAQVSHDSCSGVTEPYEGVLIQINNITITSASTNGAFWAHDGSLDSCLVDDDLYLGGVNPPTLAIGNTYTWMKGICRYTYGAYRIMPRTADDVYTAPLVCTGSSIYNIEQTSVQGPDTADCFPSLVAGTYQTMCGRVTAARQATYGSFFLQDQGNTAYGAIYGYDYTLPNGDPVNAHVGDYVQVNGFVNEYFGWTELDTIQSWTVLGTNQALPDTIDLTVAAFTQMCSFLNEPFESELVRFSNVTVHSASPLLDGKYWITDTSTGDSIRIDDDLWIGGTSLPNPLPGPGAVYTSLIGVMRWEGREGGSPFVNRGWILMPRFASDFEIGTIPPPSVVSVWTIDNTHMAVTFDRAMNTASIGTPGNYSTVHGLSIIGAEAAPGNNRKAILTTGVQPNNTIDSLIIGGVCDSTGGCLTSPVDKLYHSGLTSISVIQTPNARGDSSVWVGHLFTAKGVLTSDSLHGHYSNYFMRDQSGPPYNGIHLYIGGINPLPFLGDTAIVTGLCMEYNLETELSDLSVYGNCQILGTGPAPTPDQATLAELKAHGEYYESDLVTVCDSFQVVNTAFDSKGWLVTNFATPPESLLVYKDARWTDDYTYVPVVGDRIRGITGIFRFAWNFFRISPRTNADFNTSATYCAAPLGTIAGIAYNVDGVTPLPNVHVITHDASEAVVDDQVAGALGTWTVNLPAGTYHEHLSKSGFVDANINNIVVTSGSTTNVSFNMQLNPIGCVYVVGDANNSGLWTGQDVTYSVRFFKGGNPPPYSCQCTPGHTWYVAGDVNGSCTFSGQDVTYMVRHFKSGVPPIVCPDCPPVPGILLQPSQSTSSGEKTLNAGQ
jgi:hypothetical protein